MKNFKDSSRARELAPASIISLICLIIIVTIAVASTYWPGVNEVQLQIADLPRELDGLRILHLSDLHSRSAQNLPVDIPGALGDRSFDLLCITGDFVDGDLSQLPPVLDLIEKMARRTPVFTVLGNHDWEAQGGYVIAEMEYAGSVNLENSSASVVFDGFELRVVGVSDAYSGYHDVNEAYEDVEGGFTLTLTHDPRVFEEISDTHTTLVLAGHTHGGQIRLPLLPTLYAPGAGFLPKYGNGIYREGQAVMYVSRGIGASGALPFRFWNRPEITILTLRRGE